VRADAPGTRSYLDGGPQWAIPQADADRWLAHGSFATGSEAFRATMRHHAKGVAIITTGLRTPVGFCATSLASVSLSPPVVAFTVGLRSSSWPAVAAARYVMVHLLAADQTDLAHRFGRTDVLRFGPDTRWHWDTFGLPVLDDAVAWLAVSPTGHLPVGDHTLVIGRVIASRHTTGGGSLVHLGGMFVPVTVPG
jgi:flavin reductase (DIM6/NTAB) family NADH-FMN oxidoreductase RutF